MTGFSNNPNTHGKMTQLFTEMYTEGRDFAETDFGALNELTRRLFEAKTDDECRLALSNIKKRFTGLPAYYYARFFSERVSSSGIIEALSEADSKLLPSLLLAYEPVKNIDTGIDLLSFILENNSYREELLPEALMALISFYNPAITLPKYNKDRLIIQTLCTASEDVRPNTPPLSREECFMIGHDLRMSRDEIGRILTRLFQDQGYWNPRSESDQLESLAFHLSLSYHDTGKLKAEYAHYVSDSPLLLSKADAYSDSLTRYGRTELLNRSPVEAPAPHNLSEEERSRIFNSLKTGIFPSLYTYLTAVGEDDRSVTAQAVYFLLFDRVNHILKTDIKVEGPERIGVGINSRLQGRNYAEQIKTLTNILRRNSSEDIIHKKGSELTILFHETKTKMVIEEANSVLGYITDTVESHKRTYDTTIPAVHFDVWTVKKKGAAFTRIQRLLDREEEVTRTDIIFLLFVAYSYMLKKNPGVIYNTGTLCQSFVNMANRLLNQAGLPGFYAPHGVEFSILYAMVKTGDKAIRADNPFLLYEHFCDESEADAKTRKQENDEVDKLARVLADVDTFSMDKFIADDIISRIRTKSDPSCTISTGKISDKLLIELLPCRYYTRENGLTADEGTRSDRLQIHAEGYSEKILLLKNFYRKLTEELPAEDLLSEGEWTDSGKKFRKGYSRSDIRRKIFTRILRNKTTERVFAEYPWIEDRLSFPAPDIATYEELGIRIEYKERFSRGASLPAEFYNSYTPI